MTYMSSFSRFDFVFTSSILRSMLGRTSNDWPVAGREFDTARAAKAGGRELGSPYLTTEEVALRLKCSVRSIHELTRLRRIPHRRLAGTRRCLYLESELLAWELGADLETRELSHGGRVVVPCAATSPLGELLGTSKRADRPKR
jgi:excisionase family DNA binding protein